MTETSFGEISVELLLGRSSTERICFVPGEPPIRLIVGSSPEADWQISGTGVGAQHFELHWDGTQLWVRELESRHALRIANSPVIGWCELKDDTHLSFGGGLLRVVESRRTALVAEADEKTVFGFAPAVPSAGMEELHDVGEITQIVDQEVLISRVSSAAVKPVSSTGPISVAGGSGAVSVVDPSLFAAPPRIAVEETKKRRSLIWRRRTWALAAGSAALVGFLFLKDLQASGRANAQAATLMSSIPNDAPVAGAEVAPEHSYRWRARGAPLVNPDGSPVAADSSLAANYVLAGRYDEALLVYRKLAVTHPDREDYPIIAEILAREIAERKAEIEQ